MSFLNFANIQYFKTFDSAEEVRMGTFQVDNNCELKYIRVLFLMYAVASRGGTERIRTKVYSDIEHTTVLYTSDWVSVNLTNISNLADSHSWLGWLRTDFSKQNMNKNIPYYLSCQIDNYTRNADAFYCGLSYDFPHPIYDNGETSFRYHPLAACIFGYHART